MSTRRIYIEPGERLSVIWPATIQFIGKSSDGKCDIIEVTADVIEIEPVDSIGEAVASFPFHFPLPGS